MLNSHLIDSISRAGKVDSFDLARFEGPSIWKDQGMLAINAPIHCLQSISKLIKGKARVCCLNDSGVALLLRNTFSERLLEQPAVQGNSPINLNPQTPNSTPEYRIPLQHTPTSLNPIPYLHSTSPTHILSTTYSSPSAHDMYPHTSPPPSLPHPAPVVLLSLVFFCNHQLL